MQPRIVTVPDADVPRHVVDITSYRPPAASQKHAGELRAHKALRSDLHAGGECDRMGNDDGSVGEERDKKRKRKRDDVGWDSVLIPWRCISTATIACMVIGPVEDIDTYFSQRGKAAPTSDRTLAGVAIASMDGQAVLEAISRIPPTLEGDRRQLRRRHVNAFPRWRTELMCGFNILLYGFGSKKALLEDFARQCLGDCPRLIVNGHFPSLTLRHVLGKLAAGVAGYTGAFRSPADQCDLIRAALERDAPLRFFLVIHNIDGTAFRGEKAQAVLADLAVIPRLHIVASIDHLNAPLIWDHARSASMRWVWHDATTYESYVHELSYEGSLLVRPSSLSAKSILVVLRSLTPNARGVFSVLAQYQLQCGEGDTADPGLSFHDYYARCREQFLVNSDLALRTQLVEFKDHAIIRAKKGADGVEYLRIPVEPAVLRHVMDQFGSIR